MFDSDMPEESRPRREQAPPVFHTIQSKYEFVMAAAKEAERLNDRYRNQGIHVMRKVTVEAVDRVTKGNTRIAYEEPQAPAEEAPKESTYFFGN
jgi:DNA-directed RNA polymerase subunit K/omega